MKRRTLIQTSVAVTLGAVTLHSPAQTQAKAVVPTEDLMRDHGILRRALLVCHHCASLLHAGNTKGVGHALHDTAVLFGKFGGEYHEKAIEERFVFPTVMNGGGSASRYPAVLILQHERSNEFLRYVQDVTKTGIIPGRLAGQLAAQLNEFDDMYRYHAAHEDTVVFPAWKAKLSDQAYAEMQQQFEEVEHKMNGEHGFEDALKTLERVESELGILNLAKQTMPSVCKRVGGAPDC
jgi:hemerythrin-like domain-containing protein